MFREGRNVSEIAKALGVARASVYRALEHRPVMTAADACQGSAPAVSNMHLKLKSRPLMC
jgi:hypothetical protein